MAKQKWYVVWVGRQTGIFTSWDECKKQIEQFAGAVYKSYPTQQEAEKAFQSDYKKVVYGTAQKKQPAKISSSSKPILPSLAVDAAWNTRSGVVEYKGVSLPDGKEIFIMGPFADGTNNLGEFLAIVHALALCKKKGVEWPIYSDSQVAIKWVKDRKLGTKHTRSAHNTEIFDLVDRAMTWLSTNTYKNQLLKWETKVWGENPADFGRK